MRQATDLLCVAAAGLAGGRGPLATALLSVAPGGGGGGGRSLATALLLSVGGAGGGGGGRSLATALLLSVGGAAGGGGGGGSLATALLSVGRGSLASLATALLLLAAAGLRDRTGRGGPTRGGRGAALTGSFALFISSICASSRCC